MCGIAGILGADSDRWVVDMTVALRHRGPDLQATLARPFAHVGAARLRIVDLSVDADQPLVSSRTGAVLVFNGEIYNYPTLKKHLEGRGHRFETATDSEVVLRAYEEYGWRCVDHLRGMYAFAIVDGARALLARDPLGIKPLHYCRLNGGRTLAFASEIKSLLRCADVPAAIDELTLGDIHTLEYAADPRATIFKGISSLEPGHCLEIGLSGSGLDIRGHCFTQVTEPFDPAPTIESAEQTLDELLGAAVLSHQMADVPICLTLSGGLDSTLLGLVLRQQVGEGVVSYIVSDGSGHEDIPQAAAMARMLGFDHRPVLYTFEQFLGGIAPSIIASESFTDCGVPQYLLCQEIGRNFRVAFNGEGADELFGGYQEHWSADRYVARLREAPLSVALTERGASEREKLLSAAAVDSDTWMLDHFLGSQLTDRHLHPLDKFGMSASVEIRVPYLDYELAAYVRRLPASMRVNRTLGSLKYILRRVYARRWQQFGGSAGLMDAVLRAKLGFPDARRATEIRLHELCNRVLPDAYYTRHPRQSYLFHKTQAIWFDLFEHLFCERRGVLPPEFDFIEFLAERAARPRSEVTAVAAEIASAGNSPRKPAASRSATPEAKSEPPDNAKPAVGLDGELAGRAADVEQRLCRIIEAVGGRDVRTNGAEIWFATESTNGLEIRLGTNLQEQCYDRSANFTISYGGGPSDEPPPAVFDEMVGSIKALDDSPIAEVAVVFGAAAALAAGRFSDGTAQDENGSVEAASQGDGPHGPYGIWERHLTRKLNVVFLDLCASLIGKPGQRLSPLHWGFWPTIPTPQIEADDYDPFEAFSENLLAHVPTGAKRIMDIGCGLGVSARILAARHKQVTAVSPVAHHCAMIDAEQLPGVEVKCARFEELAPEARYDLLLFSESVNHFALTDQFFAHCRQFLAGRGYVLLADDLTEERIARIASQRLFRVVETVDISRNVAPTDRWWTQQMRAFTAMRTALMSILDLQDPETAARVRGILAELDSSELKVLFSGEQAPPVSKGRYMIYLLQLA